MIDKDEVIKMLFAGELAIMHATLEATIIRADGTREYKGIICRKKVTRGFAQKIVQNMAGDATNIANYKYHDSGTGTNAEANTDTALQTPAGPTTRAEGTQVAGGAGDTYTYQTVATIGPYPVAVIIAEHIVADAASRATSEIIDRSVFAASTLDVKINDSVEFTYTLSVTAEV